MKTHILAATLCALGVSMTLQAQPYPPYGPAGYPMQQQQASAPNPSDTLRDGMNKLVTFLAAGKVSNPDLEAFLAKEIVPYFDFDIMTQLSAGPMLRRMGEDHSAQYTEMMKRDFLTTLAQRLASYTNQRADIVSVRPAGPDRAMITVAIANPQGYPARLDFRMHYDERGWKVYDVVANGSSAVMHYRRMMMDRMRTEMRQYQPPAPAGSY